jgi:hypothetical protein
MVCLTVLRPSGRAAILLDRDDAGDEVCCEKSQNFAAMQMAIPSKRCRDAGRNRRTWLV